MSVCYSLRTVVSFSTVLLLRPAWPQTCGFSLVLLILENWTLCGDQILGREDACRQASCREWYVGIMSVCYKNQRKMYPFFVHFMEINLYISSTALNSSIYESNHFVHVQLNFLLSVDVITVKVWHPCNRPWRPIRLWDVEAPTFSRQSAHRWRWGCQPYAPAALYPQEYSCYSFLLEAELTPGP
jgi:hypothetical protein